MGALLGKHRPKGRIDYLEEDRPLEKGLMEGEDREIPRYFVERPGDLPIPRNIQHLIIHPQKRLGQLLTLSQDPRGDRYHQLPPCQDLIIWELDQHFGPFRKKNQMLIEMERFPCHQKLVLIHSTLVWQELMVLASPVDELIIDSCTLEGPYEGDTSPPTLPIGMKKLALIKTRCSSALPHLPPNLIHLSVSLPEEGILDFGNYLPRGLKILSLGDSVTQIYGTLPKLTQLHLGINFMEGSKEKFQLPESVQILRCPEHFWNQFRETFSQNLQLVEVIKISEDGFRSTQTFRKDGFHEIATSEVTSMVEEGLSF